MLSVEQCKRHIKKGSIKEKELEEHRDSLYQLANILVDQYIEDRKLKNGNSQAN